MIALLLAGCVAFGAGDQYVGSLTRVWGGAWQIPALSAPWLLLPFLVGRAQREARGAAIVGFAGTLVALVAYGAMTISPAERAQFTSVHLVAFVRSNVLWFVGSAISGPLFGYFGYRWRVTRSLVAAWAVAGAVTVEPVVHASASGAVPLLSAIPLGWVTATEFAFGLALAGWFGWQWSRQAAARSTTSA